MWQHSKAYVFRHIVFETKHYSSFSQFVQNVNNHLLAVSFLALDFPTLALTAWLRLFYVIKAHTLFTIGIEQNRQPGSLALVPASLFLGQS